MALTKWVSDGVECWLNHGHLPETLPSELVPKVRSVLPFRPELLPALLDQLEWQLILGVGIDGGTLWRCWHGDVLRRDGAHVSRIDGRPDLSLVGHFYFDFFVHCLQFDPGSIIV